MDNIKRQKYEKFCEKTYVPIYSKPWWMDAVCGPDHWDVWFCENESDILAAMPYYFERRENHTYITKALLTQNNGLIFNYPKGAKQIAKAAFEEKVIDLASQFINSMDIDVYEQQYHYSFTNWLPFYWNGFTAITRYTYVIDKHQDIEEIWEGFSSKYRKNIKKGSRNACFKESLNYHVFYMEHEKVFKKQGLQCPFTFELWERLFNACKKNNAGKILYAETKEGEIASVLFLIWDEESVYHLLGGSIPEYQKLETYNALTWEGIKFAHEKGLKYDFEGSVIKRISKSFREFGGEPKPYFRIRKVFNPEIVRQEAENLIKVNKLES